MAAADRRAISLRLARRACAHCAIPFAPRRAEHRYCAPCYYAGRAGWHLSRAAELLAEARR